MSTFEQVVCMDEVFSVFGGPRTCACGCFVCLKMALESTATCFKGMEWDALFSTQGHIHSWLKSIEICIADD